MRGDNMLIGICGKSGSGKSTLSNALKNEFENVEVLSIDKVGHEVLTFPQVMKEIEETFGSDVTSKGYVDRKVLGEKVFVCRHEMDKLTRITWKAMEEVIDKFIEVNNGKTIILDWLLLPKTKYLNMCDLRILVDVDFETRLSRAIARDGITEEAFRLRDGASIDYDYNDFDVVVDNAYDENVRRLVLKHD